MPPKSVLLFGDINIDNIFLLSEFPEPGRDGFANHVETHLGGAVCNSAAILQGLGQPTMLFGAVGEDIWSTFVYDELHKVHIDPKYVLIKRGEQTGLIFIAVTPNGERTMLAHRGANIAIQPEDIPLELLDHVNLLELSGYVFLLAPQRDTAWELIHRAVDRGIPISMDTGLDPVIMASDSILEALPYLSVLITGAAEAEILTHTDNGQRQIEALLSLGPEQVAIKLGHEGAIMGWANGMLCNPAFPVSVVDTTSAGDAFSAGLLYGYLHNFSPSGSLLLANAMGGLATTVYGAARLQREEALLFISQMRQIVDKRGDNQAFDEVLHKFSKI